LGLFKEWISSYRLKAAAKGYVARLPAQLLRDYGASDEYTPAQIEASVRRAKLPEPFISVGYVMFLPRENFDAVNRSGMKYEHLRWLVRSLRRGSWSRNSSCEDYSSGQSVDSGWVGWDHDGHHSGGGGWGDGGGGHGGDGGGGGDGGAGGH